MSQNVPHNVLKQFEEEYNIRNLVLDDYACTADLAPTGDFLVYEGKNLAIYRLVVLLSILEGTYINDPNLGINILKYVYRQMNDDNVVSLRDHLESKIRTYEKDLRLVKLEMRKDEALKSIFFRLYLKYLPAEEDITLDFDFVKDMQVLILKSRYG